MDMLCFFRDRGAAVAGGENDGIGIDFKGIAFLVSDGDTVGMDFGQPGFQMDMYLICLE